MGSFGAVFVELQTFYIVENYQNTFSRNLVQSSNILGHNYVITMTLQNVTTHQYKYSRVHSKRSTHFFL